MALVLDWNTTTTMVRDPGDGLYKADVTLDNTTHCPVEFKFVHDHVVWEKTPNACSTSMGSVRSK